MLMRIGAVAKKTNLSVRRILQYEKEGLLLPKEKTDGGHRLYSEQEINHIKNIVNLIHEHGLTLAGIKVLLRMSPCWKIFPCMQRDNCSAYKTPEFTCWELRQRGNAGCACVGDCERCPIYLVRNHETDNLMESLARLFQGSHVALRSKSRADASFANL